jgi:hypothetical protein
MFATLLVATVILSILSLLPLWRHEAWWVRSLDFPRLQLLVISLLLLFLESVFLDLSHPSTWGLFLIALLCFAFHADLLVHALAAGPPVSQRPLYPVMHAPAARLRLSHFALLTELVFEGGRDIQQSGLKADADDLAWAKLKADEQGVSKSDVPQPGNAQNSESRIERHLV